jgi:hypothetical protein
MKNFANYTDIVRIMKYRETLRDRACGYDGEARN